MHRERHLIIGSEGLRRREILRGRSLEHGLKRSRPRTLYAQDEDRRVAGIPGADLQDVGIDVPVREGLCVIKQVFSIQNRHGVFLLPSCRCNAGLLVGDGIALFDLNSAEVEPRHIRLQLLPRDVNVVLVEQVNLEPVVERLRNVHDNLLVAGLQITDTVLRGDELFDQFQLVSTCHRARDLIHVNVAHGSIRADIPDRKACLPRKERGECLILLAVGVGYGLFAEVALLEARLRILRINSARRMRAPADQECRRVLCARVCRHAADDLIARGVLLTADHGIAHREAVEGIEVIVRVAVEDVGRNGVRESADECGILTAAELLAVRGKRDLLDIHAGAILEDDAGVLHLLCRGLVPSDTAIDAAHRGLRHGCTERGAVAGRQIAHLPCDIIHDRVCIQERFDDEIDAPVRGETIPKVGERQRLCSECCHRFFLLLAVLLEIGIGVNGFLHSGPSGAVPAILSDEVAKCRHETNHLNAVSGACLIEHGRKARDFFGKRIACSGCLRNGSVELPAELRTRLLRPAFLHFVDGLHGRINALLHVLHAIGGNGACLLLRETCLFGNLPKRRRRLLVIVHAFGDNALKVIGLRYARGLFFGIRPVAAEDGLSPVGSCVVVFGFCTAIPAAIACAVRVGCSRFRSTRAAVPAIAFPCETLQVEDPLFCHMVSSFLSTAEIISLISFINA
nr:MAG TPA: hypothetical protein [Caudoviricetes sp.]